MELPVQQFRVESKEHYVCYCDVFLWNKREIPQYLFKQDFGPLLKVIDYKSQQHLGLFFLELKVLRDVGEKYNQN